VFLKLLSVFVIFWRFVKNRRVEASLSQEDLDLWGLNPQRSAKVFPWVGLSLGVFALMGMACLYIWAIVIKMTYLALPEAFIFLSDLIINISILGIAVGMSSIFCHHPKKWAVIGGLIGSSLTYLIYIVRPIIATLKL
jgi:hypothetical protein